MEVSDRSRELPSEFNRGSSGKRRSKCGWDDAGSPVGEWSAAVTGEGGGEDGRIRRMGGRAGVVIGRRRSARNLGAGMWWRNLAAKDCGSGGGMTWHIDQHESSGPLQAGAYSNAKLATEGDAKNWDPNGVCQFDNHLRLQENDDDHRPMAAISVLQIELLRARNRVKQLQTERHLFRKKLKHFLKGINQELLSWTTTESRKLLQIVLELKGDLETERRNYENAVDVNSKLLSDLADADSSTKETMQKLEKEKNSRGLLQTACQELREEIEEQKSNVKAMAIEFERIQEEVEEERKIMQMAEVWREEHLQMKLVDAKLILEEKYTQMNNLIADLEAALSRSNDTSTHPPDDAVNNTIQDVNIQNNGSNRDPCLPGGRRNKPRKMRGCIHWPQGRIIPRMNGSKADDLEARKCSCVTCLSKATSG